MGERVAGIPRIGAISPDEAACHSPFPVGYIHLSVHAYFFDPLLVFRHNFIQCLFFRLPHYLPDLFKRRPYIARIRILS
jgi:hypothetical protein